MKDEKKTGDVCSHHGSIPRAADECLTDFTSEAEDKDLSSLLKHWHAPVIPPSLDTRIAASFHQRVMTPPFWKRLLTARIPVPVPAAVLVMLLLSATSFWALHATQRISSRIEGAVSTAAQTEVGKAPAGAETEVTRGKASPSNARRPAGAATALAQTAPAGKTTSGNPARAARKVFSITLQDDRGTIQCFTDTEYRLIPVPKIFAGGYFTPSEIR
jgi:hypothetical protein